MFKQDLIKWTKAMAIRTVKTFAETMCSMILLGMGLHEVDWGYALSVSAVAAILCVLTCVKGLPEVKEED